MKPIIVIEGVDAVGKTTLAKGLANALGGIYQKSPSSRTSEEKKQHDQPGVSTQTRFDFYLQAAHDDLIVILEGQKNEGIVVRDRYISSTITHHQAMDPSINFRDAFEFDKSINRTQILLVAKPKTIAQRLSGRPYRSRFEIDENLVSHTQELFKRAQNSLIIDTDSCDIKETLSLAMRYVRDFMKK